MSTTWTRLFLVILLLSVLLREIISKKGVAGSRDSNGRRAQSTAMNKRNKSGKKSKKRTPILPERKEPLSSKALQGWQLLQKKLKTSTESMLKSTTSGTKQAIIAAKVVSRGLKSYFSSDFEALLLRVTKPDDKRPPSDDIERILATISTFIRNIDMNSDNNPYRVTLRKIWNKISEPDVRTKLKALHILHIILRYSDPEDAIIFKRLMDKMSKEYSRKSKNYYFKFESMQTHFAVDTALSRFSMAYATCVSKRAKAFTSEFEEMKVIGHGMQTEDICAQMAKAFTLLDIFLDCKISEGEECELTALCQEAIASDMRQLLILYHDKLTWIVREDEIGEVFDSWAPDEVKALLTQLITYYNNNFIKIKSFLDDTSDCLRLYGIKINTEINLPEHFQLRNIDEGAKHDDVLSTRKKTRVHGAVKSRATDGEADFPTIIDINDSYD